MTATELVERIWSRDPTVWTGSDEAQLARLARRAVADARGRRPAAAVRGLGRRPDRRGRAARHGRLVARARGAPADLPAGDVPRPRHDASAGDPRPRGEDRPRAHAVHLRLEVGLDARDALAHRLLLGEAPARRAVGRDHRSRLVARRARARAGLRRDLRGRADDRRPLLGALAVRDGAGGADGRRRRALPAARPGDGRGVPARRGQPRPRARPLARRGLAGGARQDLHRADAGRLRPLGRAAARRVDREARQGPDPGARASPPTARTGRRRRCASPTSTSSGRSSSAGSSRPPSPGRSSASTRSTSPTCRRRRTRRTQMLASGDRSARRAGGLGRGAVRAGERRRLRLHPGVRQPDRREAEAKLAALAERARQATGCVVTHGFGPRYLHSTGQLHKGGPPTGLFLQVVDDTAPSSRSPASRSGSAS